MRILFLILFFTPTLLYADFIRGAWEIQSFVGSQSFAKARPIIGKYQSFDGGWAGGVFYNCDFAGQVMTYTKYSLEQFLANKEFDVFKKYAKELEFDSNDIFVHRISCNGKKDEDRALIYPFVTTDKRKKAYYLFEEAIYILKHSK